MRDIDPKHDLDLFQDHGPHQDKNPMTAWVLPWADLMMIMFVLFVALFIYASSRKDTAALFAGHPGGVGARTGVMASLEEFLQVFGGRGPAGAGNLRVYERTQEILYKSGSQGVSVIMEPDGSVRVVLRGDPTFARGRAEPAPGMHAFLQEVAGVVRMGSGTVHIAGHAEEGEGGLPEEDLRLSGLRASATAGYFIRETGLDPRRFVATGMGASRPDVPALSDADRAMNRRVEIVILSDAHSQQ